MRKWRRIVRLTVSGKGGSAIYEGAQSPQDGFKIGFSVTKTIGSKQNTASITIWNLTRSRRNQIGEEFDQLKLEVGYEGSETSVLYEGDIRDVTHEKSSPDVQTTIECGSGDKAIAKGKVSKTFPSGTKPKEIVKHLVKGMPGVELGDTKGLDELPATKRPVTVFGRSSDEMDTLGRQHGFYWSVQNKKVQAVKSDKHLGPSAVVSKETGMIGIPQETDKGVKFKMLLDPKIEPGRAVQVKSDFLDEGSGRDKRDTDAGGGMFRVSQAAFSGDTRADEFYVECEASRIQGDKVTK